MVVKVLKISIYFWESDDAGQLLSLLPCFGGFPTFVKVMMDSNLVTIITGKGREETRGAKQRFTVEKSSQTTLRETK